MNIQKVKAAALGLSAAIVIAGSAGLASTSANAAISVKPRATGVGFAHTKFRAKRLAIRAWSKAVSRRYGSAYANFYKARGRRISCDYIGHGRYKRYRSLRRYGGVYGEIGNVNSPYTCTATARPARFGGYPTPHPGHGGYKPVATGIGFAHSKAGAQGLAIRAWSNAVNRAYGPAYARFSRAGLKNIACDYIGRGYRSYSRKYSQRRRGVIGQAGNVNSPWTCTATGRPRY